MSGARERGGVMGEVVIVSSVRTAVGKAPKGTLRQTRPDDMAAAVLRAALGRVPAVEPAMVDDVILGCAMPEAEQGMNMARQAALLAGIPASAGAMTVNRYCASGLNAIALGANAIRAGEADVVVAGGAESMSLIPMMGHKVAPNPALVESSPDAYLAMGMTAEVVAQKYGILVRMPTPSPWRRIRRPSPPSTRAGSRTRSSPSRSGPTGVAAPSTPTRGRVATRAWPRSPALRPAFAAKGTVTAGNSSQMSDGAAATVLVSEERARALGLEPIARLVAYAVAGVPPEIMGIGPVEAVPKALRQAGLKLEDIDLIELNEAFATQALAVIRTLGLDPAKVNVNGGAIALGHPLGCTGAKLTAQLLHEMARRKARYGLVTMCVEAAWAPPGSSKRGGRKRSSRTLTDTP